MEYVSPLLVLLITVGAPILLVLALTLLVRTFPEVLREALAKRIQHGFDVELEDTRAIHQERLATGTSSVSFLSSMQSELRVKTIESAEILWRAILSIKSEFSDLTYVLSILYPDEIRSNFRNGNLGLLARVEIYRDIECTTDKIERISTNQVEETRLFVGDRLWKLFFVFRAFHGRLGTLMQMSFERYEYLDWREDDFILWQLRQSLDDSAIESAKQDPFGGVQIVVSHLEFEFLREATRVMSGSQTLADSLADVQSTLAVGFQVAREIQEKRKHSGKANQRKRT
ncbi:MAG: hypothetical protein F4Y84_19320 [Caldilineaceae bacterium SB0665_bin_25]|nr:hypothetical protein [Caldilineaceae bacterium SB0665_bin_25]